MVRNHVGTENIIWDIRKFHRHGQVHERRGNQRSDGRMRTENRQQEPRRDVSAGSFLLEKNHRDDTELARICRRYEGVACLNSNGKGEKK